MKELATRAEIEQQQSFQALLQQLGQASPTQIELALAEREMVEPEPELSPQTIARLQQLLTGE
ncbi:hypothetical protein C7B80_32715 [Cyanosarcina cf. burmensis CCALA 770]|nr:hypothetical protein C7B80_32715 [Cyanosarcina cf. burmensis CCALA 770]